jgi:tripartite-type tricarboxylate transporter receptor subunit TctC
LTLSAETLLRNFIAGAQFSHPVSAEDFPSRPHGRSTVENHLRSGSTEIMKRTAVIALSRRALINCAATAVLLLSSAFSATAQTDYPNRPVRVIVPFAAGGPSDIIARIIADALYQPLGQSFVIENRAGGGANIGIGLVARAEPDGYTLLATTSAIVINPSLYKSIPFDPIKSFAPISDLAISSQMISTMPSFAVSLADFVAKAKAAPGKFNYSSPGLGTQAQLTVELLKLRAGIDLVHVPFTGGPPAVQALMSGTTQLVTNAVPTSEALARQGVIKALAVSGEKRWPSLPDVPTLVESGYSGFVTDTFAGLFAPAGTPKEIVEKIANAVKEVMAKPEVIAKVRQAGFQPIGGGPEVLAARVQREVAFNRDIVAKAGIEPR